MSCEITNGFIEYFSCQIGTTVPALKLLLTIFAGYPLALIHRKYVYGKEANLQHLYFIFTGFALGYWNYGNEMFHNVLATFFTFCVLSVLQGTATSVAITFVFNLTYLLIGYIYSSTDGYDINWTLPQCILVLRLIAISFDLYDGKQPEETLSAENKKVALKELPSILELYGHSLFPTSFLVGPQFSMRRYLDFVEGKFSKDGAAPDSTNAAVKRFCIGAFYLSIFHVLGYFVSDEYLLSEEFASLGFFRRMLVMGVWGRFTLYKYISCWLLTEGACMLFGMSHNGTDETTGEIKWNGVENIKLAVFENTTEFNHYIQSFNVNTNHWVAQYIYKRLKFLNNRHVSQLAALLFLAVWHGFHSGYYVCFFFEFIVIYMERDIKSIVGKNETLSSIFYSEQAKIPLQIALRLYTFVFMGWCLIPFGLLQFGRYWRGFSNCSWVGAILFCLWPVAWSPLLRMALKKLNGAGRRSDSKTEAQTQ
ncbi:unnamed protein product [Brassicogethes aeneus]|uniref:Lysophospholipid acyltransferase 5 n=1 Tax=Brassicogethes aeneus TaxID=1431903 RepID=A0A9P0AWN5_BRAAE|nr:unnamed protein product [Brassicogethes aeneus]